LQVTGFGCLLSHHQTMHGSINYTGNYIFCHNQENIINQEYLKLKIKNWERDLKPYKTRENCIDYER
jgi:hypothetical protein